MSRICHSSLQMPVTGPKGAMARRPIHEPRSRLKVRSESWHPPGVSPHGQWALDSSSLDLTVRHYMALRGVHWRAHSHDDPRWAGVALFPEAWVSVRQSPQFQTAGTSCACANAGTAHAIDYAACGRVRRRSGNPARLTSTIRCRRSGRQSAVHCRHDCRRPTTRLCGVG